jgi:hypothetical protein
MTRTQAIRIKQTETVHRGTYRYTAIFEPAEEGGYVVTIPALNGLTTEGDTLEEARAMAADAIRCYSARASPATHCGLRNADCGTRNPKSAFRNSCYRATTSRTSSLESLQKHGEQIPVEHEPPITRRIAVSLART